MPSEELQRIIKVLRSRSVPEEPSVEEMRANFERDASLFPPAPDVHCEGVQVGHMQGEWIQPDGVDPQRAILYLHGGGFVMGSINTHRGMISRISRAAGARALAVNYRLAPEHPFPAAVEDSVYAYRWLLRQGLDSRRIAIVGDSAGGCLAVASLVKLRDEGGQLPAAVVCLSPWVDLEARGKSMVENATLDPIVNSQGIRMLSKLYLQEEDPRNPLASPIFADLSGLPPMLIQVGSTETLLDDARRLAQRAKEHGVDVILECWEEMIHVWHFFAPVLPEGRQAIERVGEFIVEHIC